MHFISNVVEPLPEYVELVKSHLVVVLFTIPQTLFRLSISMLDMIDKKNLRLI